MYTFTCAERMQSSHDFVYAVYKIRMKKVCNFVCAAQKELLVVTRATDCVRHAQQRHLSEGFVSCCGLYLLSLRIYMYV